MQDLDDEEEDTIDSCLMILQSKVEKQCWNNFFFFFFFSSFLPLLFQPPFSSHEYLGKLETFEGLSIKNNRAIGESYLVRH